MEPGKTKINPGFDGVIGAMSPGERRTVVVPAALAYGKAGTYPPEVAGEAVVQPEDLRAEIARRFELSAQKARDWPAKTNPVTPV